MSFQPDDFIRVCTKHILNLFETHAYKGPRTYGFEYEFLPHRTIGPDTVEEMKSFLISYGCEEEPDRLMTPVGMCITFEPGGQIEYCSPTFPLRGGKTRERLLSYIEKTNRALEERFGVLYLATGYLPGRADAPLCRLEKRYRNLHERLGRTGSRGREMMKGTASVHLHVGIRNPKDLAPVYRRLVELTANPEFAMSAERRDIWKNTDPCRSGLPDLDPEVMKNSEVLLGGLIRHALGADVLGTDRPFFETERSDLEGFLDHFTTIFTDVRINLKGPSVELRTPDSMPFDIFRKKWTCFTEIMETV